MTNLDKALVYYKDSEFTANDSYILNDEFTVDWVGEGEFFIVDRHFFDNNVGQVTDPDIFHGNFDQCLNFCVNFYKTAD